MRVWQLSLPGDANPSSKVDMQQCEESADLKTLKDISQIALGYCRRIVGKGIHCHM